MITKNDAQAAPLWKLNAVVKYNNKVALEEAQARERARKEAEERDAQKAKVAGEFTAYLYSLGIDTVIDPSQIDDLSLIAITQDGFTFQFRWRSELYLVHPCSLCGGATPMYIQPGNTITLGKYLVQIETGRYWCSECSKEMREGQAS